MNALIRVCCFGVGWDSVSLSVGDCRLCNEQFEPGCCLSCLILRRDIIIGVFPSRVGYTFMALSGISE